MLIDTACAILSVYIVETFVAEVSVPVDAEVVWYATFLHTADVVCSNTADRYVTTGKSHRPRIVIAEVSCDAASVIIAAVIAIVNL